MGAGRGSRRSVKEDGDLQKEVEGFGGWFRPETLREGLRRASAKEKFRRRSADREFRLFGPADLQILDCATTTVAPAGNCGRNRKS